MTKFNLGRIGRRNLSNYQRSDLALQLEGLYKKKAKEKKIEDGKKARNKQLGVLQTSAEPPKETKPINTREELAKIAGVLSKTIRLI